MRDAKQPQEKHWTNVDQSALWGLHTPGHGLPRPGGVRPSKMSNARWSEGSAVPNNKNALKHGFATREAIRERAEFRAEARQFLADLESETTPKRNLREAETYGDVCLARLDSSA